MSASNEWTEYHLTPSGWTTGTQKTDFGRTDRDDPTDRVQTVRVRDFLSSGFSKVEHTREVVWESADKVSVADLIKQHGEAPDYA